MRDIVYDKNGRMPRFVVFEDAVVNQHTGQEITYSDNWMSAYCVLYVKYKKDGL